MIRRNGFTLIELLVAAALAAVALGVIAAAFSAGFRVWFRASRQGGASEDAILAFETVVKDIRNAVPNRMIEFRGSESRLVIPSIVCGEATATNCAGVIRYEFNAEGRSLDRIVTPVEFTGSGRETKEAFLTGVTAVKVAYADAGPGENAPPAWRGDWTGRTNMPVAVRIKLELRQGDETIEFERTTVLPCH